MTREISLIIHLICFIYILIVGLCLLGLLVASVRTWMEIAFYSVRRCVRKITSKGRQCARPSTRRKHPWILSTSSRPSKS